MADTRSVRRPAGWPRSLALTSLLVAAGFLSGCGILGLEIEDRGVVRFLEVEGGCWVIDTGSERYDPTNLPDEFRVDGLRVWFEAEPRTDLAGFCPGRIVELEAIRRIS